MGKLNNLIEKELFGTFCLLDEDSIVLLGTLFSNDVLQATAPRLTDWLVKEMTNEILRRQNDVKGSPSPLDLETWPDIEIGLALAGCLMLRRACTHQMQEEFTDLLTDVVSIHAIKRLVPDEFGLPEWN